MAQKRRITPIMVSSEVSTAAKAPQLLQQAAPAPATPTEGTMMSQEEQAEEASKVLGPGRHIYVELKEDYNEVSWPKLLKERGVRTKKPSRADGQEAGLAGALDPGAGPIFKDPPKRGAGQSVLSSVIHKLEQQFVMNGPDDSDEEADGVADKGSEEASEDTDGDAAGNEDDQGGFNDLYDMDDEFIDDTELQDYFGSDRRKTKYSGFFVNKGEIEKTDEEIVLSPDSPPKKRRRVKKPEDGAAKALSESAKRKKKRPRADEAQDADQAPGKGRQSQKLQSGQPVTDAAAAADRAGEQAPSQATISGAAIGAIPSGVGDVSGMAPSTDQGRAAAAHVNAGDHGFTQAQALFGPEVADASVPVRPRNVARKSIGGGEVTGLPGAPEDGAQDPSELNKEVLASIEKLKRAAEKQAVPELKSGAAKQMPVALKAPIKAFAVAVMRQTERQKNTLKAGLDAIMPVMEPHTTRQSLSARIKTEWQKTKVAADRALADLKSEVDRCLLQGGGMPARADDDFAAAKGPTKLAGWTWNEQRKKLLWEALTKVQQVKGGGIGPGRGAKIYAQVAGIFPAGTLSKDDIRNAYNEEKEARAARAKEGKPGTSPLRASQQSSELPSLQPGTPYAASSAAHSSQPRPGSVSARPASAASQEQAPMQHAPAVAAFQPVPPQAPPAQHTPQPLPATAAAPAALPPAAVGAGGAEPVQSQRQLTPQLLMPAHRPASAAVAGMAGCCEQHTGTGGGEQHEMGLFQAAGASESGHSRRSEAEHAERLHQAVEAAASQGADRKQLQSLVNSFKKGSAKAIVNEVLMHAGPEGLTIAEVIEKANVLGLTDPAWEVTSSRKSNLSSVLNSDQTAFVHIGKSRYAHAAQEGVVHVPHARRKAASSGDTSQAAAASQPDGAPAMAPRPTQPPLQLGGMLSSQAPPMPAPSAAPHIQLGVPVEPPPAGHLSSSFGSLQRIGPGAVAAAVQGPHASVAENMPNNAAPIRQ